MSVSIKIKWNKQTFEKVAIDPSQGVIAFKKQVCDLTGVPSERQKLMAKGAWPGILKDEVDLNACTIKDGLQVMLMGTADVMKKPQESVTFIEDMSVNELAEKGAITPAGMINLGNTCYMNSTLQCLRYMPELRAALLPTQRVGLPSLLKTTCDTLDRSGVSLPPAMFVQQLRQSHPQFAERSSNGNWMQQDAEEFYNTMMTGIPHYTTLYLTIPHYTSLYHTIPHFTTLYLPELMTDIDAVKFGSLLGLQLEETWSCQETEEEASFTKHEDVNKIVCNIQGIHTHDTHMTHT